MNTRNGMPGLWHSWSAGVTRRAIRRGIPLATLDKRASELDKTKRVMVVCARGPRSYQAANILKRHGFADVRIVGGGVSAAKKPNGNGK